MNHHTDCLQPRPSRCLTESLGNGKDKIIPFLLPTGSLFIRFKAEYFSRPWKKTQVFFSWGWLGFDFVKVCQGSTFLKPKGGIIGHRNPLICYLFFLTGPLLNWSIGITLDWTPFSKPITIDLTEQFDWESFRFEIASSFCEDNGRPGADSVVLLGFFVWNKPLT